MSVLITGLAILFILYIPSKKREKIFDKMGMSEVERKREVGFCREKIRVLWAVAETLRFSRANSTM